MGAVDTRQHLLREEEGGGPWREGRGGLERREEGQGYFKRPPVFLETVCPVRV